MSTALRAFWPITRLPADLSDDLIEDALDDLPRLAMQAHAHITGRPRWHILPGRDVPGAAAYPWVLMCLVPAERVDHLASARAAYRQAGL